MATKPITINMKVEDAANLKVVMQDAKIEKGPSETLRICVEDAYRIKTIYRDVLENAKKFDNTGIVIEENDLKPKSFLVEDEIFKWVYDDVKDQLDLLKPRISYVTKLCLSAARSRFEKSRNDILANEERIEDFDDGKSIPSKGDGMMMLGRLYEIDSAESREKLIKIHEIMEG